MSMYEDVVTNHIHSEKRTLGGGVNVDSLDEMNVYVISILCP
jgi:hypothetical protein